MAAILLVAATRLPLLPKHLFSFDSVNLALALDDFDPTRNQPQPPGYPLFVAEARLVRLVAGTPQRTFALLGVLIGGLSVAMLYLLGKEMFSAWAGLIAAALLFVNPPFWYSGLTSALRPHLALFSILVAYCCWRVSSGHGGSYLFAASLALGIGSGFRPELLLLLLPLWGWAAWQPSQRRLLLPSTLLIVAGSLIWVVGLSLASGGPRRMIAAFLEYVFSQTQDTSMLLPNSFSYWRRNAGRAVVWTGLGVVAWAWALPFGWLQRREAPEWRRALGFLAAWFLPPFLFHFLVHVADPDHALIEIPALCLLGGFCLVEAEQILSRRFFPELKDRGLMIWVALLGNVFLFFAEFPLPRQNVVAPFRGLSSLTDAVRIGTYESSYARVRWVEQMAQLSLKQIDHLKSNTDRPVVLIWARDGEPVWRKLAYELPSEKIYALEEKGDPGIVTSMVRLWTGNQNLAKYTDGSPIRVPIPKGGRLIWVIAPLRVEGLQRGVPLQEAPPLYYTDLPQDSAGFRWGSFEFVPQ